MLKKSFTDFFFCDKIFKEGDDNMGRVTSIIKSKIFMIVVVIVIATYIGVFPHTKTTKVNAELTGVFIIQKERYLLHQRVSFETEFICMAGTTVQSQTIYYRLNGDIKSTNTNNCDGTYEEILYNSNGTRKYNESTMFVGVSITTTVLEYNSFGLLESQVVTFDGGVTTITNEYSDSNFLENTRTTTEWLGEKSSDTTRIYNDQLQVTERIVKQWDRGIYEVNYSTIYEYEEGIVNNIIYVDSVNNVNVNIICDINECILNNLQAVNYNVQYNNTTFDYDITLADITESEKIFFTRITAINMINVIAEIDIIAQAMLSEE